MGGTFIALPVHLCAQFYLTYRQKRIKTIIFLTLPFRSYIRTGDLIVTL